MRSIPATFRRRAAAVGLTLAPALLTLLALGLVARPAHAGQPTATAPGGSSVRSADDIREFVERAAGRSGARVEVRVGELDSRIRLAPCARIEPFVPPGARLWGRSSIGVRCVQGATWSVSLPVTVSVFGNALVASGPLAAGMAASADDFHLVEIDLTRETGAVVDDPAQLAGRVLSRPIAAGQTLRSDYLKVPPTIAAGDPVKFRMVGDGFSISGDGVALAPAGEGQTLRIRTENGKIVAGTVRDRTVELKI